VLLLSVQLFPPRLFADDDLALAGIECEVRAAGTSCILCTISSTAATKMCRVSLTLFRESDPGFVYRPVNVSGDIGPVIVLGANVGSLGNGEGAPRWVAGDDYFSWLKRQ